MKYLFEAWPAIKQQIKSNAIVLCLDFDGTLTPIVERPEQALLSADRHNLLEKMAGLEGCSVVIVSGRALPEWKEKISIKNITYVGNHGFEMEGPRIHFKSPIYPSVRGHYSDIKRDLEEKLLTIPGVVLEDKGATMSVHCRLVPPEELARFTELLHRLLKPYLTDQQIRLTEGKKVFEIRPPIKWDKGKAVAWLLTQQAFSQKDEHLLPIAIGDDVTDEDLFEVFQGRGISVVVGEGKASQADYYLRDCEGVYQFLKEFYEAKTGIPPCPN